MRNLLLAIFAVAIIGFATALPGEEAIYEGPAISYSVEKGAGEVLINLQLSNPADFEEIKIVRSDNPVKYFRQIKYIGSQDIKSLTGSDVIVDKFPLPASQHSFYKVITIDRSGVQKSYPSVKLEKF